MSITPGKFRRLAQAVTADGHFVVLAIDHRRNLWDSLAKAAPAPLTEADFIGFKLDVISALVGQASALLTDPQYGIGPGLSDGWLDGRTALLAPVEVTDYSLHPSRRAFVPIPDWGVEKIQRVGGAGVKLLLYYHPQAPDAAERRDVVMKLLDDCRACDVPLYLEPIAFSPDPDRALTTAELTDVIAASADLFSTMGADVLKLEFPVNVSETQDERDWAIAVQAVDRACRVPWALLSAGVDYATFVRQAQVACAGGASGVIVGRAVWAEAVSLHGDARREFLLETGRQRMAELAAVCASSATSVFTGVPRPQLDSLWYESY